MKHYGFLIQQTKAIEETQLYINNILATGKCYLSAPPDCFIWTGTKKQLNKFHKKYTKKYERKRTTPLKP